jgi:protein-tyrosine sulfotransferase
MRITENDPELFDQLGHRSAAAGPNYEVLFDTRSTEAPLVTIMVVMYNQARYVSETLESVAAQEFTDFELIIIDDASQDDSVAVSLDWARRHDLPLLLIRNRSNQGVVATLATATGLVRTELISLVAGDDLLEPSKLSLQVPLLLESAPNVGFVYSDAYLISDDGDDFTETWLQTFKANATPRDGDLFEAFLTRDLHIPVMTLLARTNDVRRSGAFSPGLHYEDVDLMIRLSHVTLGRYSRYPSVRYRVRPDGLRAQLSPEVVSSCRLRVYRPWLQNPRSTRPFARRQYFQDAYWLYRHGDLTGLQFARATFETRSPKHLLLLPFVCARQAVRRNARLSAPPRPTREQRQVRLNAKLSRPSPVLGDREALIAGDELIFVGGSPRSGSTLLQNMLDSHPRIAGGPEFDLVPSIVNLRKRFHEKISSGRISAFTSKRDVDHHIGTLIEQLLLPYMESHKADYISEKTPSNVMVFRELLTIFPGAHFLFCVRDPRAVVASMLEVGRRDRAQRANGGGGPTLPSYTRSVFAAIETIRRYNQAGFHAAADNRVQVVPYELLVQKPEATTREVAGFLGIAWDSSLVSPKNYEHGGDSLIDGIWAVADTYRGNPDPARTESWQSSLRRWQRLLIEAAFSGDPDLLNLGYSLGPKRRNVVSSTVRRIDGASRIMEVVSRGLTRVSRRLTRRA